MGVTAPFQFPYFTGAPGLAPPGSVPAGSVNLLGADWMLDLSSDEFGQKTVPMTRQQLNVGAGSGEESLSSGMMWLRSFTSWHHGAGQPFYDDIEERDPFRFRSSRHVDVWTEGELSLLPTTSLAASSTAAFQRVLPVSSSLWWVAGTALKAYDAVTWVAAATGTLTAVPVAVTSAGDRMYAALPTQLVQVARSGATFTQSAVTGLSTSVFDGVRFEAGRLFAWKGPSLWEVRFTSGLAGTLELIEQRPTGFQWVGVRQASGGLFAAGNDGARGTVWVLTINAEAASGWAPATQRLELPDGETVLSGDSYMGFLTLATSVGVRLVAVSADGGLAMGAPLAVPVSGAVGFEGQGRFVWAGMTHPDGQSGLVRMDLSVFTSPLTPAWACDLEAWTTAGTNPVGGLVESVTTFLGTLVFTVAGKGMVAQNVLVEKFGTLEQGAVTFGTADPKTPSDWTVVSEPLQPGAKVQVLATDDLGRGSLAVTHEDDGANRKTAAGRMVQVLYVEPTMSLTQTQNSPPVVLRYDMRVLPTTRRTTVWTIPIVLSEQLDFFGSTQRRHPEDDYQLLVRSVMTGELTMLRLSHISQVVQPIEFEWRPVQRSGDRLCWSGTFVLQCLTVEGT